jgi:hypothetical protein
MCHMSHQHCWLFLSISIHQSLEILVCPLCNLPFSVLSYLICSILIPDHYLRLFSSHCLAHCLSIARHSFMYLIYACFSSLHYTSISLVVILWLIVPVLPIVMFHICLVSETLLTALLPLQNYSTLPTSPVTTRLVRGTRLINVKDKGWERVMTMNAC